MDQILNIERREFQPYCESWSELCGVWKCMTVAVEMKDIFHFIMATISVNLVLVVLAMCLFVWGICKVRYREGKMWGEYTI